MWPAWEYRTDRLVALPHKQRIEKLLEDALIKLSTVATDIFGTSGRDMIEVLISGQRDPHMLAELARGRLRVEHAALVQALTGRFDDYHAVLARILLDQIDTLTTRVDQLTVLIYQAIAALPDSQAPVNAEHPSAAAPLPTLASVQIAFFDLADSTRREPRCLTHPVSGGRQGGEPAAIALSTCTQTGTLTVC